MPIWSSLKSVFGRPSAAKADEPDKTVEMPEGVEIDSVAQLGVAHLTKDGSFSDLVQELQKIGFTEETAPDAAERIAAGMFRTFLLSENAAPDPEKDPLGRAAFDVARAAQDAT
ncbi:MAG: hypothetical protein OXQ92_01930 [Boseongicola sp.]|nr:hypothetical protein [Boseongicola sp.]MDD9978824.1 hypothetical protein [Boseongicola sp.]